MEIHFNFGLLTFGDMSTPWSNIRLILGIDGENGKENGNYYNGLCRV